MSLNDGQQLNEIPDGNFKTFKRLFAAGSYGVSGGFIIQQIGGTWFDPKRKIRDSDILDHLEQRKSVAVVPAYYPTYFTIDLDFHSSREGSNYSQVEDRVMEILDQFQLHESEYLRFTSPSYQESGNQHIIVQGTYNGVPASARLTRKILEPIATKACVELFPWGARKLRLPFGYGQNLIDNEDGSPLAYSWSENLQWVTKIEPLDLERYPFQHSHHTTNTGIDATVNLTTGNGEYLWEHGLQANGTRNAAIGAVARLLYLRNWGQEISRAEIKNWIRIKHNGFSKEIRKQNWRLVDAEIDAWVDGTYDFFEKQGFYPTAIHNIQGWMTRADVNLILDVFPGDWINQKRFCRLLQHYRARTRGTRHWIPMHRKIWGSIIGSRYIDFQKALEGKILEINNSYRVGAFSKRILLRVPPATPAQMICGQDGRAENSWRDILLSIFGNIEAAACASKIHRRRFYES